MNFADEVQDGTQSWRLRDHLSLTLPLSQRVASRQEKRRLDRQYLKDFELEFTATPKSICRMAARPEGQSYVILKIGAIQKHTMNDRHAIHEDRSFFQSSDVRDSDPHREAAQAQ